MRWSATVLAATVLVGVLFRTELRAEEKAVAEPYSGDFMERTTLTGDWGGFRNEMAAKGVTVDANIVQVEQGVVTGGKSPRWEYGGRGNLTLNADSGKMGLWPGGFMTVEIEGSWEDSINAKTGALLPVDTNQLFPVPGKNDFAMPNLSFMQFFSKYAGVVLGKLDTVPLGDINNFAHGKGDKQFLNLGFNLNPTLLVIAPYSTLGAGIVVLPTADVNEANILLATLSATGKATTSGFDDLSGDELTFFGQGRLRTEFFGLTGHQLIGGGYSNKTYTSLDQRLGFVIANAALEKTPGAWAFYYNFDQYVYQMEEGVDRGIGLFGRFGVSDGNPNPAHYFYSLGVGSKGLFAGREHDQFGLGYYYTSVSSPHLRVLDVERSFLRDEWGFEAYYNIAITPWMLLTPDVQVVGPAQKRKITGPIQREYIDTAMILGLRWQIIF